MIIEKKKKKRKREEKEKKRGKEIDSWFKEGVAKKPGPRNMIVPNRISSNDRV